MNTDVAKTVNRLIITRAIARMIYYVCVTIAAIYFNRASILLWWLFVLLIESEPGAKPTNSGGDEK